MRVDNRPTHAPVGGAAPRREATRAAFAPRAGEGSRASGPAAAAPLATVDALLALQGGSDPGERRRRSVRRGHDLLDALDRIKAALLSGGVPAADLHALASRLADEAENTDDPRLDEILQQIEVRAAVEMAKLSRR